LASQAPVPTSASGRAIDRATTGLPRVSRRRKFAPSGQHHVIEGFCGNQRRPPLISSLRVGRQPKESFLAEVIWMTPGDLLAARFQALDDFSHGLAI